MINECLTGTEVEGSGLTYFKEGLRKPTKYLSRNFRCPSRDSNHPPPKYKSEALLPEPTCSEQVYKMNTYAAV
jgi:hypothetical protein